MARVDFRQGLTNNLIEALEEYDGMPWQQGWDRQGGTLRPFNPSSGTRYRGGNVLGLIIAQAARGSADSRWMTLKQANKAGYSVRKGAKAVYVEYWDWGLPDLKLGKRHDDETDTTLDEDIEEEERRRPRVFYAAVFNGEDIVGLPDLVRGVQWESHELAEKLLAASGARIEHKLSTRGSEVGAPAYYSRGQDQIVLPPRELFKTAGDYYATALHELAHWTGHVSRLGRLDPDERVTFGSPAYAREELRAEIASFFLNSMLGIEGQAQNHVAYTASWLKTLKDDKHEIFRAARDAEKIVDYIFSYAPEIREVVEQVFEANTLPEGSGRRAVRAADIGLSDDLPNFIPEGTEPTSVVTAKRTGRDDPRWPDFQEAIYALAAKAGLAREIVEPVFEVIASDFTELMDSMKRRGHDEDVVYQMIGAQVMAEMKHEDTYRAAWDKFAGNVRLAADGCDVASVESALQGAYSQYQQILVDAANQRWDADRTRSELNKVLYGSQADGATPTIDGGFVQGLIGRHATALAGSDVEELTEDELLSPLGMDEVLPEDAGIAEDEWAVPQQGL